LTTNPRPTTNNTNEIVIEKLYTIEISNSSNFQQL
jgi:hypothetical protein